MCIFSCINYSCFVPHNMLNSLKNDNKNLGLYLYFFTKCEIKDNTIKYDILINKI